MKTARVMQGAGRGKKPYKGVISGQQNPKVSLQTPC